MADVAVTYTFTNGTTAAAPEVNTNFTNLVSWINTNAVRADATIPFTAVPSGPATDPSTANQFTRKQYVDQHDPVHKFQGFTGGSEGVATHQVTGQITILDQGYDLDVWGYAQLLVSPASIGDLANLWELDIRVDNVVVGSFIIPIVQNTSSLAVFCPLTQHSAGSNCTIKCNIARIAGAQASITSITSSNRSFMDVFYRRH